MVSISSQCGGRGVSASAIVPYTNLFEVLETQPDGTERLVGTWDDRVEIETRDGREVLRRIQNSKTEKGTNAHFDEVDRRLGAATGRGGGKEKP